MGELLPQDGRQQRVARLKIAMQGIIPDGLLSRFSVSGEDPVRDWKAIATFVAQLVVATDPDKRNILMGSERANLIRGIASSARV